MELNLIIPVSDHLELSRKGIIEVEGRAWAVAGPFAVLDLPEFACVSYVWGSGRSSNPVFPEIQMSDRTLHSLGVAMKLSTASAFWIDGICMPPEQPTRGATLESMGFIYGTAKEVIVTLSGTSRRALDEMQRSDCLSEQAMRDMEAEAWVRSVWTYQEVVNCKRLLFATPDLETPTSIEGDVLLNRIGYSLELLRRSQNLEISELRRLFPRLNAFEDLIADWMTAQYSQRSALQVMANLDLRESVAPANYFHSMLASLTSGPSNESVGDRVEDLAEKTMTICEQKGDYSFIYSSAARDPSRTRLWRPRPGSLSSIVQWHLWGYQGGHRDASGRLWLELIVKLEPETALGTVGRAYILDWLEDLRLQSFDPAVCSDGEIASVVLGFLRGVGFGGSGDYFLTNHGIVFPLERPQATDDFTIGVSNSLRWSFGSPSMVIFEHARSRTYVPGVFFGDWKGVNATDFLLDDSES